MALKCQFLSFSFLFFSTSSCFPSLFPQALWPSSSDFSFLFSFPTGTLSNPLSSLIFLLHPHPWPPHPFLIFSSSPLASPLLHTFPIHFYLFPPSPPFFLPSFFSQQSPAVLQSPLLLLIKPREIGCPRPNNPWGCRAGCLPTFLLLLLLLLFIWASYNSSSSIPSLPSPLPWPFRLSSFPPSCLSFFIISSSFLWYSSVSYRTLASAPLLFFFIFSPRCLHSSLTSLSRRWSEWSGNSGTQTLWEGSVQV